MIDDELIRRTRDIIVRLAAHGSTEQLRADIATALTDIRRETIDRCLAITDNDVSRAALRAGIRALRDIHDKPAS